MNLVYSFEFLLNWLMQIAASDGTIVIFHTAGGKITGGSGCLGSCATVGRKYSVE